MATGQLKHLHLIIILGISLLIPTLVAYSIYVDLLETLFFSSNMSFDNPGNEDFSTVQNELKVLLPSASCHRLSSVTHPRIDSNFFSSLLTADNQITPVFRCLNQSPVHFCSFSVRSLWYTLWSGQRKRGAEYP